VRRRADFHRKTALKLVQPSDPFYYGDLHTANVLRNHHLSKSVSHVGMSALLRILAFKAA